MLSGLMQAEALTVDRFAEHAARWHGGVAVIERDAAGAIHRSTYAAIVQRAKGLSAALLDLGIEPGDRVATLAMNNFRHLECWYGIMGIGAVCHTLNPRLTEEQLAWIVDHAGDRVIIADASFASLATTLARACPSVERVILMPDGSAGPQAAEAVDYEAFLAGASVEAQWGGFGEERACGLCYTSGTTGNPKGVLYSHRSNYLHALGALQRDVTGLSANDVVLPIVPMFHANAWGLAFSALAAGAGLVLPGPRLDGASIHNLIESEGVTFAAAVPTVWQGLLQYLRESGGRLDSLRRVLIGGSACPEAILRSLEEDYGVEVLHAWGMTETSPIGTTAAPVAGCAAMDPAMRREQALKQGRPPFGVDLAIEDDTGRRLPHDGTSPGRLLVRGATVARAYYRAEEEAVDAAGWFDTGDIATIDEHGFMKITDRAKDVIKSGGEWISSIEIENIVHGYHKTACAAVIGVRHEKWGERPLLLVQLHPGESATGDEYRDYLRGRIASWWMPDDIRFIDDMPLGATGKIDKKRIRALVMDAA
ncbi:long-chain-fatty-acid--CoA ligase [Sphingobium sp.]|uniref:long-chain-fatty-acid--CoA ligase n=1 Tax=Sphingobium sp. TaxID=1912891 RepID=UPI0028BEE9F1|nr:long-chain-fatty-acid--CoA ligase [Sphingobium sp.]